MNLPISIFKNEDWTYTVISNIFNVTTEWNTLEEAIQNWKEALECHIEWLEKDDYEYQIYKNFDRSFNTFVTV